MLHSQGLVRDYKAGFGQSACRASFSAHSSILGAINGLFQSSQSLDFRLDGNECFTGKL